MIKGLYDLSVVIAVGYVVLGGLSGIYLALQGLETPLWLIFTWLIAALYMVAGLFIQGRDRE